MFFLLFWTLMSGPSLHKVEVRPLDLQVESDRDTHFREILAMAVHGNSIWIQTPDPEIMQFSTTGAFIRKIGGPGFGPGKLGSHQPCSFAAEEKQVWILQSGCRKAHYFEDGEHVLSIPMKNYQIEIWPDVASNIAFDKNHFVVQAFPGSGVLANVYNYGGDVVATMGAILPIEREFLRINDALNNTIWSKHGDDWFCLFVYRPLLRIFGPDFKRKHEWVIDGPEMEHFEDIFIRAEKDPMFDRPLPHFNDMKVYNGKVYAFSNGCLYQIDPDNGAVLSRTIFLDGDDTNDARRIRFTDFAIDARGTIFLTFTPNYRDRDLWTARLPFWDEAAR